MAASTGSVVEMSILLELKSSFLDLHVHDFALMRRSEVEETPKKVSEEG
jgi:hypothetical protein